MEFDVRSLVIYDEELEGVAAVSIPNVNVQTVLVPNLKVECDVVYVLVPASQHPSQSHCRGSRGKK